MTIHTHLREICRDRSISQLVTRLGIARPTVHSWLTNRTSGRLPSPRHLQALLDEVNATPEQRASAWKLLAEADEIRSQQAERREAA